MNTSKKANLFLWSLWIEVLVYVTDLICSCSLTIKIWNNLYFWRFGCMELNSLSSIIAKQKRLQIEWWRFNCATSFEESHSSGGWRVFCCCKPHRRGGLLAASSEVGMCSSRALAWTERWPALVYAIGRTGRIRRSTAAELNQWRWLGGSSTQS